MLTLTTQDSQELLSLSQHPELVKLVFQEPYRVNALRSELMRIESRSMAASRLLTTLEPLTRSFSPLEARDWHGRWTSGKVDDATFAKVKRLALRKVRAAPKPTPEEVAHNRELIKASTRPGGDLRGSTKDRARRTQKLLKEFGNGEHAPCVYCGKVLDKHTLQQDKIYTGHEGGRYRMENLLPACASCNKHRGDTPMKQSWFHRTNRERTAEVHHDIIASKLRNLKPEEHPTATFLGGGPASGKSSLAVKDKGVNIDIDELMSHLPGYQAAVKAGDPKAAVKYHQEASNLARELRQAAYDKHVSFTLDGTGNTSVDRMLRVVHDARKAGYSPRARYFTTDTETAKLRSDARGDETGRYVPHHVIDSLHKAVSRIFPVVANSFDHAELYDNNDVTPKLVAETHPDGLHVHDWEAWHRFLDKGAPVKKWKLERPESTAVVLAARNEANGDPVDPMGHNDVVAQVRKEVQLHAGHIQLPYDYAADDEALPS
jgi:predicted ABC-type ATPase/5-methylcytosine-specific restriction endonuclease McrA